MVLCVFLVCLEREYGNVHFITAFRNISRKFSRIVSCYERFQKYKNMCMEDSKFQHNLISSAAFSLTDKKIKFLHQIP